MQSSTTLQAPSVSLLNQLHSLEKASAINFLQAANFMTLRNYPSLSAYFMRQSRDKYSRVIKIHNYMLKRDQLPDMTHILNLQTLVNKTQMKLNGNNNDKLESNGKKVWLLNNYSVDEKVAGVFANITSLENLSYCNQQDAIELARQQKDNGLIKFLEGIIDEQLDSFDKADIMLQRAKEQTEDNGLIQRLEEQMRGVVKRLVEEDIQRATDNMEVHSVRFAV